MADYPATRMRDNNRKRVFEFIRRKKLVTRTMIQKEISVSSPTVMKIVKFFEEKEILKVLGELTKEGPGRKLEQLQFNPQAAYALGILFDGQYLRIGIVSLGGEIIFSDVRYYDRLDSIGSISAEFLLPIIGEILDKSNIPTSKVLGVGMAIPKIADSESENIHTFYNPDIRYPYHEVSKSICDIFGFPLFVENDVNAEAIGEFFLRNLPVDADLGYISLGTGLGSGLILDGSIRRGFHFSAGEIGHMLTSKEDGVVQIEDLVGLRALQEIWRFKSPEDLNNVSKDIKQEIISYLVDNLSVSLANIIALLDIDLMVLGGITAQILGDDLVDAMCRRTSELLRFNVDLRASASSEAGIIGSAMMAIDNSFTMFLKESLAGNN